jgi:hypothetical protein
MSAFEPGDTVDFTVHGPGGGEPRILGTLRCIVIHGGDGECDLILHPAEDKGEADWILGECDMALADIRVGPVYVLRNCQPEDLELRHREVVS